MKQVLVKKNGLNTLLLFSQEYGATRTHINLTDSNTVVKIGSGTVDASAGTVTFSPPLPYTDTTTACIVAIASTSTATSYPAGDIGTILHGTFDASGAVFTTSDTLTGDGQTGNFAVVLSDNITLINVSDIEYELNKQYLLLVNDAYDDRLEYYDDTIVASGYIQFNRPRKVLHIWNTGATDITFYLTNPERINMSSSTYYPTSFTVSGGLEFELNATFVAWQTAFNEIWVASGGAPSYRMIVY